MISNFLRNIFCRSNASEIDKSIQNFAEMHLRSKHTVLCAGALPESSAKLLSRLCKQVVNIDGLLSNSNATTNDHKSIQIHGNLNCIPLASDSVDAAILLDVLNQENAASILSEIKAVLYSGAKLLVIANTGAPTTASANYTKSELRSLLREFSFEVTEVSSCSGLLGVFSASSGILGALCLNA